MRDEKFMMLNYSLERKNRRKIILKGISQNLNHSEIANQLGVNRWVVMNDIRYMQKNEDPELKQAQGAQEEIQAKKLSAFPRDKKYVKQNERFIDMTGMSLQEKTFHNMIDFYKPELMRVLKAEDQNAAIMELPKSVRRTLKNNEIITKERGGNEIKSRARELIMRA